MYGLLLGSRGALVEVEGVGREQQGGAGVDGMTAAVGLTSGVQ